MDLETAIQTEVNHKNKYCILMHICEIFKNGIDYPIYRTEIDTDIENKEYMDPKEGKGGGMNREIGIDIYI